MATAMGAALDQFAGAEDVRVVVIAAAGSGAFCAGADLKEVASGSTPNADGHEEWGFLGLVNHWVPQPVVAAVTGSAYAGGAELLRRATSSSPTRTRRSCTPRSSTGSSPAWAALSSSPDNVRTRVAIDWMSTARDVTMVEVHERGLVNHLVPRSEVLERALQVAITLVSLLT